MPGPENRDNLPVAHPKDVGAKVDALAQQMEKEFRRLGMKTERQPGELSPLPCGNEMDRKEVRPTEAPAVNPYTQEWYVDYSPYLIGVHTWATAHSATAATTALTRLRDHLQKSGWKIVSFEQPSNRSWQLKVEAPDRTYGALLEAPIAGPGTEQRIGIDVGSPCFRHPDA